MCRSSVFLLCGLLFVSCTGSTVFHSYKPLPKEGWERRDTVSFHVPKVEEDIDGRLTIGLRTLADIGIQDVVLAVEQTGDAEGVSRCDTIRYPLTDAEGYALTGGVNNHQYETQLLPIRLRKGKAATVRIHHLMSKEMISGFTEVGIRIER